MPFELKKGKKKNTLILKDSVDISEARELLDVMRGARESDLEVDMGKVSSMDCSVLQILIAVKKALKEADNKRLSIKAKSEEADRVIKLAGAADAV